MIGRRDARAAPTFVVIFFSLKSIMSAAMDDNPIGERNTCHGDFQSPIDIVVCNFPDDPSGLVVKLSDVSIFMPAGEMNFEQVLASIGTARFLSEYWTKKPLYVKGEKGRFEHVFSWADLNRILTWHPPPQPQLRLFQEGSMVDLRRYIDGPVGNLRLNPGGLMALLAQGATMIMDGVQEVSPSILDLTSSFEDALSCPCAANVYAGWRTQKGFNVHWDAHEVFAVQLSGRKRWQVFAPTRIDPLADDSDAAQPPTAPPIWDGILSDGDVLYLPRGYWHVAYPLDEPSLHMTWSAHTFTGVEFLQWWVRTLRRHPEARKSLTGLKDPEARKAYVAKLVDFLAASTQGDPLEQFLRSQHGVRRPRSRIRLPQGPVEQHAPLAPESTIRLAIQSELFIEREAGEPLAKFFAAGTYWYIRPEFVAAFQRLSGAQSVAFRELAATISDKRLVPMLQSAIDALAAAGLLFKEKDVSATCGG
jgi:ribosomal protein L16 Arg81 hydroxylase